MKIIKNYNLRKKLSSLIGVNLRDSKSFIKSKYSKIVNKCIYEKKNFSLKYLNFSAKINNYKYFRNINGYPCRGQRTHTNAKTKKKIKIKKLSTITKSF